MQLFDHFRVDNTNHSYPGVVGSYANIKLLTLFSQHSATISHRLKNRLESNNLNGKK